MKILIVEDDPFVAEDLKEKLERLHHEVLPIAESYEGALEVIREEKPDLALLDIELKGNLTGIDLSEQLNKQRIQFIYISSIEDLQIYYKAKQTGPQDYLPKPVNTLTLRNALLEVEQSLTTKKKEVMHFFHDKKGIRKRIDPEQIVYLKAGRSYCDVYFADNTKWELSVDMKNVAADLNHPDLIKIHRSYFINLKYITYIKGSTVQLTIGPFLKITKPYRESFNSLINKI